MAQWLKDLSLPMQEAWVQSPVRELDLHAATKDTAQSKKQVNACAYTHSPNKHFQRLSEFKAALCQHV